MRLKRFLTSSMLAAVLAAPVVLATQCTPDKFSNAITRGLCYIFIDLSFYSTNAQDLFVLFSRFLIFVLTFTLFYLVAEKAFEKASKNIRITIAAVLALLSTITIPATILVSLVNTYGVIIGAAWMLLFPIVGILLIHKSFPEDNSAHHAIRGIIYLLVGYGLGAFAEAFAATRQPPYNAISDWGMAGAVICLILGIMNILSSFSKKTEGFLPGALKRAVTGEGDIEPGAGSGPSGTTPTTPGTPGPTPQTRDDLDAKLAERDARLNQTLADLTDSINKTNAANAETKKEVGTLMQTVDELKKRPEPDVKAIADQVGRSLQQAIQQAEESLRQASAANAEAIAAAAKKAVEDLNKAAADARSAAEHGKMGADKVKEAVQVLMPVVPTLPQQLQVLLVPGLNTTAQDNKDNSVLIDDARRKAETALRDLEAAQKATAEARALQAKAEQEAREARQRAAIAEQEAARLRQAAAEAQTRSQGADPLSDVWMKIGALQAQGARVFDLETALESRLTLLDSLLRQIARLEIDLKTREEKGASKNELDALRGKLNDLAQIVKDALKQTADTLATEASSLDQMLADMQKSIESHEAIQKWSRIMGGKDLPAEVKAIDEEIFKRLTDLDLSKSRYVAALKGLDEKIRQQVAEMNALAQEIATIASKRTSVALTDLALLQNKIALLQKLRADGVSREQLKRNIDGAIEAVHRTVLALIRKRNQILEALRKPAQEEAILVQGKDIKVTRSKKK